MKPVKGDVSWPKSHDPRAKAQAEAPKHRARKDTKRWCLGRPGKRHVGVWQFAWSGYRFKVDQQPNLLQLRCAHPPCNKVLVECYRLTHDWRTQWGDRSRPETVAAFYGPGLPPDYGWGQANVPDYVDVLGEP